MANSNNQTDNAVIRQLAVTLFDKVNQVQHLDSQIIHLECEIERLNKIVRDGNGQASLISQVALLGHTVRDLQQQELIRRNEIFQLKVALIISLIGSVTAIIAAFISK